MKTSEVGEGGVSEALENARTVADRAEEQPDMLEAEVAELQKQLREMTDHAEEHATSVRSLIGQRTRLLGLFDLVGDIIRNETDLEIDPVLKSIGKTESQFKQDIVCLLLNDGKRNGFFVEFGACDGLVISNSLLLEQEFGWSGILCEPGRQWHEDLRKNRNCIIDERCVWKRSGEEIEFTEAENLLEASTNREAMQSPMTETYKVPTVSLEQLLDEHGAPERIDFLSVDVEGAELDVLESAPFDRYRFDFCAIEHRRVEEESAIKALMKSRGYVQICREISGHDGFYIPSDRLLQGLPGS